ncbi:hypothetical protein ACFC18_54955, partial [Streptomyces sp. NPDC056121]|uniref:hypothetical protein n=1 Tax=Streptomyces sp. NPDC056121 TaxID=3345718 RepID=UPI0035DA0FC7
MADRIERQVERFAPAPPRVHVVRASVTMCAAAARGHLADIGFSAARSERARPDEEVTAVMTPAPSEEPEGGEEG